MFSLFGSSRSDKHVTQEEIVPSPSSDVNVVQEETWTPPAVTPRYGHAEKITEACKASRNILFMTSSQVRSEFGTPQEEIPSPKDPSGATQLLKYQASDGRCMEVFLRDDKVVDVNYTASGYGLGTGSGRRGRERERDEAQAALEAAASKAAAEAVIVEAVATGIDAALQAEQKIAEDAFLKKEGIVLEKKDLAIVAYLDHIDDGKGKIYPEDQQEEMSVDGLERVF